jgi:hypothetical protein
MFARNSIQCQSKAPKYDAALQQIDEINIAEKAQTTTYVRNHVNSAETCRP